MFNHRQDLKDCNISCRSIWPVRVSSLFRQFKNLRSHCSLDKVDVLSMISSCAFQRRTDTLLTASSLSKEASSMEEQNNTPAMKGTPKQVEDTNIVDSLQSRFEHLKPICQHDGPEPESYTTSTSFVRSAFIVATLHEMGLVLKDALTITAVTLTFTTYYNRAMSDTNNQQETESLAQFFKGSHDIKNAFTSSISADSKTRMVVDCYTKALEDDQSLASGFIDARDLQMLCESDSLPSKWHAARDDLRMKICRVQFKLFRAIGDGKKFAGMHFGPSLHLPWLPMPPHPGFWLRYCAIFRSRDHGYQIQISKDGQELLNIPVKVSSYFDTPQALDIPDWLPWADYSA